MQASFFGGESDQIFSFIEELHHLPNADAVMDGTQKLVGRFGFRTIVFSRLPGPERPFESMVLGQRLPTGMVQPLP